ncbi:hypothetical protein [Streptomyces yanii]|uniref:hypothetical protein n=1 Tax=Streptomyces yanii TaxID=78510 RepID=UPI0031F1A5C6
MIAESWGKAAEGLLSTLEGAMPSVIGLLERREARAQEELDSWLEVLRQAQVEVAGAQERAERARVAREELVQALAEESAGGVGSGPAGDAEAGPEAGGVDVGFDERPPRWQPGLGQEALEGVYREVFRVVADAPGPVAGAELARRLGRPREKNEVEKVRHRAYKLEARGWLVRESGGLFRPVPGTGDRPASPASAEHPRPGSGSA